MVKTLTLPCASGVEADELVVSDEPYAMETRSLRIQCYEPRDDREQYEYTNVWLDEARARELFNFLGIWLHKQG